MSAGSKKPQAEPFQDSGVFNAKCRRDASAEESPAHSSTGLSFVWVVQRAALRDETFFVSDETKLPGR
jgi:hypothetical protein